MNKSDREGEKHWAHKKLNNHLDFEITVEKL